MKTSVIAIAAALALVVMLQLIVPHQGLSGVVQESYRASGTPNPFRQAADETAAQQRVSPIQAQNSLVGMAFGR